MGLLFDVRHTLRGIRLNPGFAVVSIALLALGTGATTAMFQLFDAVRLRTLPVKKPEQLVELRIDDMTHARGVWLRANAVTNPIWEQIRRFQKQFSGTLAWASEPFESSPQGQSRELNGLWVSGDFFRVLRVTPAIGRLFSSKDDTRGCGLAPGAVLSYGFWKSEFGGDPTVLGKELQLGVHKVSIAGVTAAGFFGLEVGRAFDVALPICSEPALRVGDTRLDSGTTWWLTVMARRRDGVSLAEASAYSQAESPVVFSSTLPAGYPRISVRPYLAMKLQAIPAGYGISEMRQEYDRPLILLLAISGSMLLLACINLGNLMLARANARQRETAVRLALGASRFQIAKQTLTEGLLIAAVGAGIGLLLAWILARGLVAILAAANSGTFLDVVPDYRVFAFAASVAVATCVAFSMTPSLRTFSIDPAEALKSGGRALSSDRDLALVRRTLASSQIAIALALLVCTLLFSRSLRNLENLNPGFEPQGVFTADLGFWNLRLTPSRNVAFRRQILERLRVLPGVNAVSETTIVPATGANWNNRVWRDGSGEDHARVAMRTTIGTQYFRTLKTALLAGREFDDHDLEAHSRVAIVNKVFAQEIFGTRNVIGKRFWIEPTPAHPSTAFDVVGLVENTKYRDLREDFEPIMFLPPSQAEMEDASDRVVIRSGIPNEALMNELRPAFTKMSPALRYSVHSLDSWIQNTLLRERLMFALSSLFGALAVILAAVGIYGLISYTIALRMREIGVRIALGAGRGSVMALIFRETALVLLVGLSTGYALALGAARASRALLFGLRAYDGSTFAAASACIVCVALVATLLPAMRATSANPLDALRAE